MVFVSPDPTNTVHLVCVRRLLDHTIMILLRYTCTVFVNLVLIDIIRLVCVTLFSHTAMILVWLEVCFYFSPTLNSRCGKIVQSHDDNLCLVTDVRCLSAFFPTTMYGRFV